jgi:hypothetical protein
MLSDLLLLNISHVISEVFTVVTMKGTVSWDVMLISAVCLLLAWLLFDPGDGSSIFLQNFSELLRDYSVSHPRR